MGNDLLCGRCKPCQMEIEPRQLVTYKVVVRGELGDQFACLFEGMTLSRENGVTVLVGPIVDQSHMAGIIDRTQDLGLELISVCPVGAEYGSGAKFA